MKNCRNKEVWHGISSGLTTSTFNDFLYAAKFIAQLRNGGHIEEEMHGGHKDEGNTKVLKKMKEKFPRRTQWHQKPCVIFTVKLGKRSYFSRFVNLKRIFLKFQ